LIGLFVAERSAFETRKGKNVQWAFLSSP